MSKKKELGQFFTTNVNYILQGFENTIKNKSILDPFVGGGDLLKWAKKHNAKNTLGLDFDKTLLNKDNGYLFNDSLKNIPYSEFNLSNVPYLGKNKMSKSEKEKYDLDGIEDLYLLSIKKIIESKTEEGILIIPVNFLSAENSNAIRKMFLDIYDISSINYFREQVFDDTTYNVIAFHYFKKENKNGIRTPKLTIFPNKIIIDLVLDKKFDYKVAGDELSDIMSSEPLRISRLTTKHIKQNKGKLKIDTYFCDKNTDKRYTINKKLKSIIKNNIIMLNCIDTNGSEDGWIKAEDIRDYNKSCLVGKESSRNIAYLLLEGVSIKTQEKIIKKFNFKLNKIRKKYYSLFLTNFRDNDRKRISFEMCYKLISYCLENL
jgi:hypothetical protein